MISAFWPEGMSFPISKMKFSVFLFMGYKMQPDVVKKSFRNVACIGRQAAADGYCSICHLKRRVS
jgi:hypothetical protein